MYLLVVSKVFLSSALLWLWYRRQKPPKFPPGYSGIPVVGVIPFLSSNPAETFIEWGKKLGSVFYVQMGVKDFIVLNNFDSINECFMKKGKVSSHRGDMTMYQSTRKACGLVLEDYGKTFADVKEIFVKSLKNFGVGRNSIESKIHEELEYLVEEILTYDGKPFSPKNLMYLAASSVISNVTFGKRPGYKDPQQIELIRRMQEIYNNEKDGGMLTFISLFPMLRFLPGFSGAYKRLYNTVARRTEMLENIVEEHKKSFDEKIIRDIIDQFILCNKTDPTNPAYFKDNLVQALTDLFDGGSDTASTALQFCFLYLARHDDVQSKLAQEIKDKIGESLPCMNHVELLPHLSSFIDEISRHKTIVPLSVFHKTSQDMELMGHFIPKDTEIIPNLWAANRDPKYFDQPDEFIPDRFIKNGRYEKSKHLVQYSIGPRKCPGYQVADKELFIWLCGILQRFEIKSSQEFPLPEFEDGGFGLVYSPKHYKVEFHQR